MTPTPDEITYCLALAAICWFGYVAYRTLRDTDYDP